MFKMWIIKGKKWEEGGRERTRLFSHAALVVPRHHFELPDLQSYRWFNMEFSATCEKCSGILSASYAGVQSTFSEVERCHLLLHNLTDSFRLQDTAYKTEMA